MSWNKIHPEFRLNGVSLSKKALLQLSYSLIQEGQEYQKEVGGFLKEWINETDTILVSTSGSTGTPKSIKLSKQYMVNSAMATGIFFNLQPKDTALLCMSAGFIAGKMMLVRAMVLGLHITTVEPSSNPLKEITSNFDFCAMVPLQLQNTIEKLGQIKTLLVGGAPMSSILQNKMQEVSTQIYETYGMTETITHIALKKINNVSQDYFTTLPEVTLSKDRRGCLVIHAPKISATPVITNDMVALHSETEFSWLGRYDSVINSGGIKLIPEQIEEKLSQIIFRPFFVFGIPDIHLGQKLVLLVEGEIDQLDLLKKIKTLSIDKYQIPKEVYGIPEFSYTSNGKINRKNTVSNLNL